MNLKNHSAFSLIEALIAVAVMGIVLASAYALLSVVFRSDVTNAAHVYRTLLLKNTLSNPELFKQTEEKRTAIKKQIAEPPTTIEVTFGRPSEGRLSKYATLEQASAAATWQSFLGHEKATLLKLWFVPPPDQGGKEKP